MGRLVLAGLLIALSMDVSGAIAAPPRGPATRKAASAPTVVYKYIKSTPAQDTAAIRYARDNAADVQKTLALKLTEIQSEHFLIFTDWPAGNEAYLKGALEAAYTTMARYFEIPVRENVFVGRLPVYMFDKQADFLRYAREWDEFSAPDTLRGYYAGRTDGIGHLVMWRPQPDPSHGITARDAQTDWAYTLVHEFTHAFVARYRSNKDIPTWVNEGLAEILAQHQFPRRDTRIQARASAERRGDLSDLFTDDNMKTGTDYPVMQTLVEYLLYTNKNNFIPYINAMKDGTDPEAALKQFYHLDHTTLEQQWRRDLQRR